MGITDPPRPECQAAIEECRGTGIAVIRIPGDYRVVASIFLTAAQGPPEGFAPVQLLCESLGTDRGVMLRPPRRKDNGLTSGCVSFRYMVTGMYVGLATFGVFVHWCVSDAGSQDGHSLVSLTGLMPNDLTF